MPNFDSLLGYRKQFPVTARYAYLNHAAMSPVSSAIVERMHRHLEEEANHGIAHVDAFEHSLQQVRADCARLIGATASELAFVRNTSHGLSLVASGLDWRPGDNVLCAVSEEYPSNVYPWQKLARRGVELRAVATPGRKIRVAEFAAAGNSRTRLVTCSSVQYTSGFRVDLDGLGRLCAERGWLLCVDGIQSVGAIPMDVKQSGIHFLSADSHKWMLGLVGIGIFYAGTGYANQLDPALVGWRSTKSAFDFDHALLDLREDALRFEEGNLPYPLIEGMGATVRMLLEVGVDRVWARIRELNDYLVHRLRNEGHNVTSPTEDPHRSGMVTFIPRNGESAALVRQLQESGVIVSCRRGQVRVSPHFYNVEDELDRIVAAAT